MSICQVCLCSFVDKSRFKPRLYCSDNCRNYAKYKTALENTIIHLNLTPEAKKILKGDLFRLSNLIRIGTFTNYEI